MSLPDYNAVLDVIKASLGTAMASRHVVGSLVDPAGESAARLLAGVVCVVSTGGGGFANYRGREGQQGTIKVTLVGYLQVAESTDPEAIQQAELALLGEFLGWVSSSAIAGLDTVIPGDWMQSKQLEHPYGWVALELKVKP